MPVLTVFAGPNGSGKSSLIRRIEFEGRENLLEPDAISRRISPELPHRAGVSTGREVLLRTAEYLRARESFAMETTLAGNWTNSAIRAALEQSFFARLLRAAQGRHDVPDADVRRWTQALVFDNSGAEPRPVFVMSKGQLLNGGHEIPAWASALLK